MDYTIHGVTNGQTQLNDFHSLDHTITKLKKMNLYIFFPFIFISWRLITLQYGSGSCHTLTWISLGYTCIPHPDPPLPPPTLPDPSCSSQCISPEHLSHASNVGWWSLITCMFRCCSLETSHPRLLPQSPKVCSVHLCLFFCFAYRVIRFKVHDQKNM